MQAVGLFMLVGLAVGTIYSGLPVWALLLGVSSLAALAGVLAGVMDFAVLGAMPVRVMGLLESDILQALPLYVFAGLLLQRLSIAKNLYAVLTRIFATMAGGAGGAQALSILGLGAFMAPMNGSVASSASMLTMLMKREVKTSDPAAVTAWVSVASTIGVVVPPSLVLILLGDAMMRAHTEALLIPGAVLAGAHIINTQDVFHAALLPALAVIVLWGWVARRQSTSLATDVPTVTRMQAGVALGTMACIVGLLWAVFAGHLFAVEAAASACVFLVVATLLTRALAWSQWHELLAQSLALSGALFALLVGATVFSLVLRLWGTDQWFLNAIAASPLPHQATAAIVLLAVGLCAWVLDAFEMIFVIVPMVAPSLIALLGDAQQVAVLLLLVLQVSFLLPPMGYAVMLARTAMAPALGDMALFRLIRPFVVVQLLAITTVFLMPEAVHQLDGDEPAAQAQETDADLVRRMQEMTQTPP